MPLKRHRLSGTPSERFAHPAWLVFGAFAAAITVGTGILMLPALAASGEPTRALDALFTATSAVTVTGLIVVDTATHWTMPGQAVIMVLFQIGGIGIVTFASLLAMLVSKRFGLRARMVAQQETQSLQMSDIKRVVRNVIVFSLICESIVFTILAIRFVTAYGEPIGEALFDAAFHAVSAFNHAGFSINSDSLMSYNTDPWVVLTIAGAVVTASLGFPVLFELLRSWRRPRHWSVLTRLTLGVSAVLLAVGTVVFVALEWTNTQTMIGPDGAPMTGPERVMSGFFQSVTSRSSGFNSIDTGEMHPASWLFTDILMFIGGGSASTAGGIKVTTFGLLLFVIIAELRGEPRVNIGHRRIPEDTQRQALAIALLALGLVMVGTFVLLATTPHSLGQVLFEVTSGALTVGLSTGITDSLGTAGQITITVLMYLGRVGPLTLGSTLALRRRGRHYELPEERPIVG